MEGAAPVAAQVELFVLCTPAQSEALHQELIDLEVEMFTELGLHFKVDSGHGQDSVYAGRG